MNAVNQIIKFDMKTILDSIDINKYKKAKDNTILDDVIISEEATNIAIRALNTAGNNDEGEFQNKLYLDKMSTLMLDQLKKVLEERNVKEYEPNQIIFTMDFSNMKRIHYKKLIRLKNRFSITLNGRVIKVREFLKSNSMSKNCRIYYIDDEYYDELNSRLTFDLIKNENDSVPLSKWYAYTGLVLSSSIILDSIKLNSDEVVIVPDRERIIKFNNCLTAISIPSLIDDVKRIKDENDLEYVSDILYRFNQYRMSKDFNSLDRSLKDIILTVLTYKTKDILEYKMLLNTLYNEYKDEFENATEIEWSKIRVDELKSNVNYYDGEGLISLELRDEINKSLSKIDGRPANYNSFQIRLPFIKGVVHSCDFKEFFKAHGKSKIKGLSFDDNKEREYDIDKVKMILTESQFKLAKFKGLFKNITQDNEAIIDAYFRLLNKYDYSLGINNVEIENKHGYVRLNYQFFSTMPLNDDEVDNVGKTNKDYVELITSPDEVINSVRGRDDRGLQGMVEAYSLNPDFVKSTKEFKSLRQRIIATERVNACLCRVNVKGARKFLSGDLLGLLYHVIGEEIPDSERLKKNNFYMPGTSYSYNNTPFALFRNPHYSRNEIKMLTPLEPCHDSERFKYFSHLTGVVMQNPESDAADRLGGADYDGDTIIVSWDEALIKPLYYKLYKDGKEIYPLVKIPSIKSNDNNFNYPNIINSLANTFNSRVGEISNECLLNVASNYANGNDDEVAFYTILNGLEIDSAKNGIKPKIEKLKRESNDYSHFIDLKKRIADFNRLDNKYKNIFDDNVIKDLLDRLSKCDGSFFKVIHLNSMTLDKIDDKKKRLSSVYISDEDKLDIASLGLSYNLIDTVKRNYFMRNVAIDNVNAISEIANNILRSNKEFLDIESISEEFNEDLNYSSLLEKYLNDKPYYLKNDKDKLDELKRLNLDDLDGDIRRALINYDNNGFELLYLIIYYLKEASKDINYHISLLFDKGKNKSSQYDIKFKDTLYKTSIRNIAGYEDLIKSRVKVILDELSSLFTKALLDNKGLTKKDMIDHIEYIIDDYFTKRCKKYSWNELAAIINYQKTSMTFTVFKNQVIAYSKEGN